MRKQKRSRLTIEGRGPRGVAETFYVAMLDRLVGLCPRSMKAVVLVYSEDFGPAMLGSCCVRCSSALVHTIADSVEDPREDAEEVRSSNLH